MSKKDKLLNCYQDLQRAATFYYLNPKGKTHLVFLSHALNILRDVKDKKSEDFERKVKKLQKNVMGSGMKNTSELADEILTTGLLLKPIF